MHNLELAVWTVPPEISKSAQAGATWGTSCLLAIYREYGACWLSVGNKGLPIQPLYNAFPCSVLDTRKLSSREGRGLEGRQAGDHSGALSPSC